MEGILRNEPPYTYYRLILTSTVRSHIIRPRVFSCGPGE